MHNTRVNEAFLEKSIKKYSPAPLGIDLHNRIVSNVFSSSLLVFLDRRRSSAQLRSLDRREVDCLGSSLAFCVVNLWLELLKLSTVNGKVNKPSSTLT